jgi:uncharacterized protein
MILEGLVTTRDADGRPHLAPMGPRFEPANTDQFLLRPFPTSQSYQNLLRHPEGTLHVTDDALLLARAAIGPVEPLPPIRPAERIDGFVLSDCCRWFEFRIINVDNSDERVRMTAAIVHRGRSREWFGFNRARHAVVEAAILATRVHLLPHDQIEAEFGVFARIIDKTGGAAEKEALSLLQNHVRRSQ